MSIKKQGIDLGNLAFEQLLEKLNFSKNGLNTKNVEERLLNYGFNEIPEKKKNILIKFLGYFWGPIPWMIEIAIILSAVVGHWEDFGIILVLLFANAFVGFFEEYKAGNAIAALKKSLALMAKVKRNGVWKLIKARELVPGDIIRLRFGDIVPADAKLLEGGSIQVDQSALTGESLPVTRTAFDNVYSGSVVKTGAVDALIYSTGANTYFGKTARLVGISQPISHFQRAVLKIGDYLIIVALILVALILGVAIFRHDPLFQTLEFALVLAVAAIPVAMPTVLSVTMAVGARLLAAKKAIVSRLVSIEELAGVDVLCSDKTGTLTQNLLKLGQVYAAEGLSPEDVIHAAALASRGEDQDPIDLAVLKNINKNKLAAFNIVHFEPFDPVRKRSEATIKKENGACFKVTKGAPQIILQLCKNKEKIAEKTNNIIDDFASRGFRSLGVARTVKDNVWQFLGVMPFYDPPREDSKVTIETAKAMGVAVKMVTGDHVAIGKEISLELGLGTNILDAKIFEKTSLMNLVQLTKEIEEADGFAQVFPEHKHIIVDVLQKNGHIVAMTGDGVNDAPALKKADCGIAVSGATDAARAAADIVLLSPGLSVIVDAIKESRKIFQRMNSYATYRIAETIRVLLFMTLSILIFNFYPVTAVMIVLLALLNDGAILSIAYDRVLYSKEPEKWNMHIVLGLATVLGIMGVISSFGLFYLLEQVFHFDRATIQTFIYLKLSVAGHLTIFITRTRKPFWSFRPSYILISAVFGTQIIATLFAIFGLFMSPITWWWALLVWAYALFWFIINDLVKLLTVRTLNLNFNS